jgi:hypothetical protein
VDISVEDQLVKRPLFIFRQTKLCLCQLLVTAKPCADTKTPAVFSTRDCAKHNKYNNEVSGIWGARVGEGIY